MSYFLFVSISKCPVGKMMLLLLGIETVVANRAKQSDSRKIDLIFFICKSPISIFVSQL